MEVVDGEEIAGHCLLGTHQEMEAGHRVVGTRTTCTFYVNRCKVVDAARVSEIQLAPGYQSHPTSLSASKKRVKEYV